MLIDPQLTLIRAAPQGREIYAGAMRRIAQRSEPPPMPPLHFSGLRAGEFLLGTVFIDPRAMSDMFTGYTVPESSKEMNAAGTPIDIARFEYEVDQLYIEASAPTAPFGLVDAGGIAACTLEVVAPSPESYWQVVENGHWFDEPIPGRIAHVAYRSGEAMHAIGFWESREIGHAWYLENMFDAMDGLEPGKLEQQALDASWLELDTFFIAENIEGPLRNFARKTEGPVSISPWGSPPD